MAYNVISCIEVAEITQTLKIADFTMQSGLWILKITVYWGRGIASPSPLNRYVLYWVVPWKMKFLGAILVPILLALVHLRFYNIWDCVIMSNKFYFEPDISHSTLTSWIKWDNERMSSGRCVAGWHQISKMLFILYFSVTWIWKYRWST